MATPGQKRNHHRYVVDDPDHDDDDDDAIFFVLLVGFAQGIVKNRDAKEPMLLQSSWQKNRRMRSPLIGPTVCGPHRGLGK